MAANVRSEQRHTRGHPCTICGGHDGLPRGKEVRCNGYTSLDGKWCFCSRIEDGSMGERMTPAGPVWMHLLRDEPIERTSEISMPKIIATYNYEDETGKLVFQVARYEPKTFRMRVPLDGGGWSWKVSGIRRVIYRAPLILSSSSVVFLVEGEKDADALAAIGLAATTTAGGANSWAPSAEHAAVILKGRDVCIIADADDAGRLYAKEALATLLGVADRVVVTEVPKGKDASDWIAAGAGAADFMALYGRAPEPKKPEEANSLAAIVESWAEEGKVSRIPTGLASFDICMRGGFPSKRLVIVGGAPGAGKTTLVCWWAWQWAKQGIPIGIVASDEDADGLAARFALFEGFSLSELDAREATTMLVVVERLRKLPIRVFNAEMLVEDAAARVRQIKPESPHGVLVVDSIQTASTAASAEATSSKARVDAMVTAVKRIVAAGLLVLGTSELNRGAYRNKDQSENYQDMAAAKESGAIEYAAQTLMVLRSVEDGEVEIAIPKNRGYKKADLRIYIDPGSLRISERDAQEKNASASVVAQAKKLQRLMAQHPGKGASWLRTTSKISGSLWNTIVEYMLDAKMCEDRPETNGKAIKHRFFAISNRNEDDESDA